MSKNLNYLFKSDLIILSILKEKDYYGYEMTKVIALKTNNLIVPKVGTLYPTLYELLRQHYISSYETFIGSKVRIYYHIEEPGRIYLDKIKKEYLELIESINSVVLGR